MATTPLLCFHLKWAGEAWGGGGHSPSCVPMAAIGISYRLAIGRAAGRETVLFQPDGWQERVPPAGRRRLCCMVRWAHGISLKYRQKQ